MIVVKFNLKSISLYFIRFHTALWILYQNPTELLSTFNPTRSNKDEIKPLSFQQYLKAISSTGFSD